MRGTANRLVNLSGTPDSEDIQTRIPSELLMSSLLKTPLHALHVELGAKMVPFAGYDMPVQYPTGVMAEHKHTRAAAGLFDVSHMGQVRLVGADAAAALETLVPVDIIDLGVFKQRYALFTNDQGGLLDDLMVCKRPDDLFVVVNAGCKDQDIAHMQKHLAGRCEVIPVPERALLALQGPEAVTVLSRLNPEVAKLTFMTGGFFQLVVQLQHARIYVAHAIGHETHGRRQNDRQERAIKRNRQIHEDIEKGHAHHDGWHDKRGCGNLIQEPATWFATSGHPGTKRGKGHDKG